jgi:FkbM family methyltransferase
MPDNFIANIFYGVYKKFKNIKRPYKKYKLSWLDMRYIKNMPEHKINTVKFLGKNLTVNGRISFMHALRELFQDEIYKIDLPSQPFIIDCGANIGLSVIYFKYHYPNAQVLAFEPDDLNFSLLEKNIGSYGYTNVILRKEAVWTENTYLSFSNEGTMSSRIDEKSPAKVKAIRIKELLHNKIDLLKIDIEGAEYRVIKDIQDQLHYVQNMFLEYHGNFKQNNELIEIFKIVHEAGFTFYIKEATSVYDHPFIYADARGKGEYDIQLNIFCCRP